MKCPCCGEEMEYRAKIGKMMKLQCKECGLTDTRIIVGDNDTNQTG